MWLAMPNQEDWHDLVAKCHLKPGIITVPRQHTDDMSYEAYT